MLHDLAFYDCTDDVAQGCILLKGIFARLQFRARPQSKHSTYESPPIAVDHALALQHFGDIGQAGPRGNVDDLILLQRTRRLDDLPSVIVNRTSADHHQQYERYDGVADDNKRVARALRALGWRWNLFGFERGARTAGRNGRPFTHCCNLNPV